MSGTPPTASDSTATSSSADSSSLPFPVIIGIAAGGAVLLLLLALVVAVVCYRSSQRRSSRRAGRRLSKSKSELDEPPLATHPHSSSSRHYGKQERDGAKAGMMSGADTPSDSRRNRDSFKAADRERERDVELDVERVHTDTLSSGSGSALSGAVAVAVGAGGGGGISKSSTSKQLDAKDSTRSAWPALKREFGDCCCARGRVMGPNTAQERWHQVHSNMLAICGAESSLPAFPLLVLPTPCSSPHPPLSLVAWLCWQWGRRQGQPGGSDLVACLDLWHGALSQRTKGASQVGGGGVLAGGAADGHRQLCGGPAAVVRHTGEHVCGHTAHGAGERGRRGGRDKGGREGDEERERDRWRGQEAKRKRSQGEMERKTEGEQDRGRER